MIIFVNFIYLVCEQFERLLEQEAQIESYLEWLESLVHKCVLFVSIIYIKFSMNIGIKINEQRFNLTLI